MLERIAPEQHDTLDDVPEPAENTRLIGHRMVADQLAQAYRTGKLPHALILAGPQGIGKATLAFHLAYHLLKYPGPTDAPDELGSPDPSSALFRQIASGAHPGVLHLTRPLNDKTKSFKTAVTVDEIRRVGRFLSMTSHDGGWRVVIVDPADDMNTNAANALLKNLEEPPNRTVFILIAHSIGGLLPTIRSRCQTVRLQPLGADDLVAVVGAFVPEAGTDGDTLAARSGGSPRTAILLTQYGGLEIAEAMEKAARDRPDVTAWHRIADAVAGRDQPIRFGIFNRHALDMLAAAAAGAAAAHDLARSNALAEAWHAALNAVSETETYNLDKKQHALNMIDRLNAAMRM